MKSIQAFMNGNNTWTLLQVNDRFGCGHGHDNVQNRLLTCANDSMTNCYSLMHPHTLWSCHDFLQDETHNSTDSSVTNLHQKVNDLRQLCRHKELDIQSLEKRNRELQVSLDQAYQVRAANTKLGQSCT